MTRTDLLNHLAEKYQLENYLEIGLQNADQNFNKIICPYKLSVDPDPAAKADLVMTSDKYFDTFSKTIFDLIFIDGSHIAEHVMWDFHHSLKVLSPQGFIVLHDCNPEKEEHTIVPRPTERGHWNGNVWRFAAGFMGYDRDVRYTVDVDNGCTVFRNHVEKDRPDWDFTHYGVADMPWSYFEEHRKELLNLISWDEFINL